MLRRSTFIIGGLATGFVIAVILSMLVGGSNTTSAGLEATSTPSPTPACAPDTEQPVVKDVDIVTGGPLKGKPILFSAEANDNCNQANELHYKWSFDDGGTAFGPVVAHTFAEAGLHSGVVRAFDKAGNEGARDFLVSVGINPGTSIKYEGPIKVNAGDPTPQVELIAVLFDHDGNPLVGAELQFTIRRADGAILVPASAQAHVNFTDANGRARVNITLETAFPPDFEIVPLDPGDYNVVVEFPGDGVYDPSIFEKRFSVTRAITSIKYEGPISVLPNDPLPGDPPEIELSAVLIDHKGRAVVGRPLQFTIRRADGAILSPPGAQAEVNFTDGNGRARVSMQLAFLNPVTNQVELLAPGDYFVFVVFKGDTPYSPAEFSKLLTIHENLPPVVSALPTGIKAPWGVDVEFSGFATDPDGGTPDSLKYVWDFGDGTPNATNQKVTHAFPAPGDYTVTLTVTDKNGASTEVTTDVTINKRPTTIKNCGETQTEESAHKVPLCGRLLVADLDGGDLDAGVKGKTLSFSLAQKKFVSGDTDANGESRPSVNLILAAGCIPGAISFAGDDLYESFTYEYVYYTVGGGRPGQVCELNVASAGFQLLDSDGDGCSNGQEAGTAVLLGGMRDSDNAYDFFDVPVGALDDSRKDKAVNVRDIGAIVARFGTTGDAGGALFLGPIPLGRTYHPAFDRTLLGPEGWNLGPPDGKINVIDIALVITQFGNTCA